jgi:hypothetical protein
MDFLQRVAADVSLNTRSLFLNHYSFPFTGRESGASTDPRLANGGQKRPRVHGHEEKDGGLEKDWVGTVELAGTVTVPPRSVRIAR